MSIQNTAPNLVCFFKCNRSETTKELLAGKPKAFLLLFQIAYRAQRTNQFNRYNLAVGEALIGDFEEIGLTQGQYRCAKKYLVKHGFITIRTTNRGTIAKLINTEVFDPNMKLNDGRNTTLTTSQQRASNEPTTTTKNDKNVNNDKNVKTRTHSGSNGISPSQRLFALGKQMDSLKEEMKTYKQRHFTEYAARATWDKGCMEGYVNMRSKLKQMEEEHGKLLQ